MTDKRRYLVVECGEDKASGTFMHYANVQNVVRYGLMRKEFEPGQYNIYLAPEGTKTYHFQRVAYKRV